MPAHYINYGDSLTPLGVQLFQEDDDGQLDEVDLTSKTVKVLAVKLDGTEALAETTTGVTVTDADDGKVAYDFRSGSSALPAGTYYFYFRVYSGTERDTFPTGRPEDRLKVVVCSTY